MMPKCGSLPGEKAAYLWNFVIFSFYVNFVVEKFEILSYNRDS